MAWSSETRLAVAMARKNKAFLVLSKNDAFARGSNGGPERYSKTLSKSQGGGGKRGLVEDISKDRMRSLRIGEVEISGRGNLKTADNMALYPLMVERAAPLRLNK